MLWREGQFGRHASKEARRGHGPQYASLTGPPTHAPYVAGEPNLTFSMEASASATVLARIVDRIRASSAADAQSSSPRVESVEQLRQAHEEEVAALQVLHQAELRRAQAGGDLPVGLGGARVDTAVKPKREAEELDVQDVESIKAEDELTGSKPVVPPALPASQRSLAEAFCDLASSFTASSTTPMKPTTRCARACAS